MSKVGKQFSRPEPAPMLGAALGYAITLGWLTPLQARQEFLKFPSSPAAGAALGDRAIAAFEQFMADHRSAG